MNYFGLDKVDKEARYCTYTTVHKNNYGLYYYILDFTITTDLKIEISAIQMMTSVRNGSHDKIL